MLTGYHLRFLNIDDAVHSIHGADIVRVPRTEAATDGFGVQLHARPTPAAPHNDGIVLRLTREACESEGEFVKRAFREAAARQRQLQSATIWSPRPSAR
jgi:hypothetical protein